MASFDSELDALFRTSAKTARPAPPTAGPSTSKSADAQKKRKNDSAETDTRKSKKSKALPPPTSESVKPSKKARAKPAAAPSDSDDSDDNADVEEAYAARVKPTTTKPTADAGSDSDSDSDDADAPPPVHESLLPKKEKRDRGRKKDKTRYVPPGETREQRDARTIFVGNVPVDVVKSKSGKKQLERHVLSLLPSAKIESTRFRSVAFATPTGLTDPSSTATPSTAAEKEKEDTRAHGSARAAHWRAEQPEDAARKKLTPNEKKKIAFIKQEVHEQASAVHAYIVFAHADPSTPAASTQLDPYEAAAKAVEVVDGTTFMGRTLHVDAVAKEAKEKRSDPRRTVFVGNLDFATKDEDLRVYFEGVVSAERGPPGDDQVDSDSDDEEEKEDGKEGVEKGKSWVKHVRIVRDKDTQLGKGFAYIEFADRECVDELLAMEEGKLKFAKRKLRVQRCKTLPGSAPLKKPGPKSKNKPAPPVVVGKPTDKGWTPRASTNPKPIISLADLPKGDPRLGERLAGLDKDARKAAKAADADRIARRMAKKKVRAASGLDAKKDKEGKKRVRERKDLVGGKGKAGKNTGVKKSRVRSERQSLEKRNAKK